MIYFKTLLLITFLVSTSTHATHIVINDNSPYTVLVADVPSGHTEISTTVSWTISANQPPTEAHIWAQPGCASARLKGHGSIRPSRCDGPLHCTGYRSPPNNLAEYAFQHSDNLDFFEIPLVQRARPRWSSAHGDQPNMNTFRVHQGGHMQRRRFGPVHGPAMGQVRVRRPEPHVQDGQVLMQLRELM